MTTREERLSKVLITLDKLSVIEKKACKRYLEALLEETGDDL